MQFNAKNRILILFYLILTTFLEIRLINTIIACLINTIIVLVLRKDPPFPKIMLIIKIFNYYLTCYLVLIFYNFKTSFRIWLSK